MRITPDSQPAQMTGNRRRQSKSDRNELDRKPVRNADSKRIVECLYDQFFGQLVGFLRSTFGAGPPPPEDLAQAAFERLLGVSDLDESRSPKAFLWRTATNLAISAHRRIDVDSRSKSQLRTLFSPTDSYPSAPERVLDSRDRLNRAYEVILAMPKQRRESFLLVRIDGLSQTDAASRLGISRPAVSKHLVRATRDIIEAFDYE